MTTMFGDEGEVNAAMDAALAYYENEWSPVAIVPGEKSKTFEAWGEWRDKPMTLRDVREQFEARPDAGVGLVLRGDVFRLDLDGRNARALLKSMGVVLPDDAPTLKTGRADGGEHVYLRSITRLPQLAGDKPLVSSDTGRTKTAIEVRVNDLAPVPPTLHPSGRPYEWIVPLTTPDAVPYAPSALLELVASRMRELEAEAQQSTRGGGGGKPTWVSDALRGVGAGERDMIATKLAGYLFSRELPPDVVREIMLSMGERCDPPMQPSDIDRIVKSIGKRHPATGDTPDAETPDVHWHRDAILEHARRRTKPGGEQWACPLPFPSVNRALRGGFKSGRSYYLGGDPGMGKTALVINVSHATARLGLRVLIVSAEMPREAVYDREIAIQGELDVGEVEDGKADAASLLQVGAVLAELPIAIANDAVQCLADIDKVVTDVQPNLVIVDYLQLMAHAERGSNPRERVEALSRGLKMLAKKRACAVLCVSSLRRGDRAKNTMPTQTDLRESGALEFDADGIMLLGMKGDDRMIDLTKNRFGPPRSARVRFDGARMTFSEIADEREIPNDPRAGRDDDANPVPELF